MITEKEAAIISAHTGILFGRFCDIHKYVEQIMGRPVFTHEFANKDMADEIKQKSKRDFCNLVISKSIPEPKPLAQYLAEHIAYNIYGHDVDRWGTTKWRELLEQALDAYESTEHVKIIIQKV